MTLLACFWNDREPVACETACTQLARESEMSLVHPPAGWHAGRRASARRLADKANAVSHYGAEKSLAASEVYLPDAPGVALFVTAIAAKVSTESRSRGAHGRRRATCDDATCGARRYRHRRRWLARARRRGGQAIEATLQWRDTTANTVTHARLIVAADGENLIAVTGECVAADAEQMKKCEAALATLDPGITLDKRVALALAPAGQQRRRATNQSR